MSDVAQALGLKLKAERERRGVSAQKMADDMHLDGWVIEALEAGDYQRIGPAVYAKGHLRKYASLLGVSAVDGPAAEAKPPAVTAPAPIIRLDRPAPTGRLPGRALAGAAVAAVLVGGVVWLRPWHVASTPKTPAAPAVAHPGAAASAVDAPPAPAPAPAAASVPAPSASPAAAGLMHTAALSAAAPRPGAENGAADLTPGVGRARLRLSFSADSRVDVYDFSGKRIFAGNGRANSVQTIAGIAPFRVYLGFASGVQLQVNDRAVAIGPQFVTGDVARFEAGADGVLRRDTRANPNNGAPAVAASPRG
ncbi:MAG: helix-turn-helix domain-containing protein [Steroidobacteraceae bacterium]|jgi:cytoskeleton protein RodZ